MTVSSDVKLYPIEGEDDLSYFYANGRVWIVVTSTGEIVASPGYVVPESAVAWAHQGRRQPDGFDRDRR